MLMGKATAVGVALLKEHRTGTNHISVHSAAILPAVCSAISRPIRTLVVTLGIVAFGYLDGAMHPY